MWNKIKSFFIKITPSKRKIIQLYAALLHNANIKGFVKGEIFKGDSKIICAPGLNCYSCPGAVGACPLGSLQNALAVSNTKLPTYVLGILLLFGIILGRTICGFLCPVGLVQELLYKIKTPKLQKNRITRIFSYFKYVLLFVLVIAVPIIYGMQNLALPGFCKYVCPAGTLGGAVSLLANPNNDTFYEMIGQLFTWKFLLLIIFMVSSVFIYRFFCRFFCPLGAIYGLFNKISILGVKVDKSKCNSCGACVNHCKMDVKVVGDHECINCGECRKVCHANAIKWKTIGKLIEEEKNSDLDLRVNDASAEEAVVQRNVKKISRRKLVNIISISVATVVLVAVMLYANLYNDKTVYSVNDVCDNISVSLIDDTKANIVEDSNATIVYYYDEFDEEVLNVLSSYSNESLNVVAISSYASTEANKEYVSASSNDYNITFAFDDKSNSALALFSEAKKYPYFVVLDSTDKVILKQEEMIDRDYYTGIIYPTLSGKTVGNKVGDICISQNINIIGSEDTFSVLQNRGKITVINFWYTTCTPCVEELPYFNALYEEYSDYIEVIAIHEASLYAKDPAGVLKFITIDKFPGYTIKFGYDLKTSNYYQALGGSDAFPMTVIVDQNGIITFTTPKSITENQLRQEIEKLI